MNYKQVIMQLSCSPVTGVSFKVFLDSRCVFYSPKGGAVVPVFPEHILWADEGFTLGLQLYP